MYLCCSILFLFVDFIVILVVARRIRKKKKKNVCIRNMTIRPWSKSFKYTDANIYMRIQLEYGLYVLSAHTFLYTYSFFFFFFRFAYTNRSIVSFYCFCGLHFYTNSITNGYINGRPEVYFLFVFDSTSCMNITDIFKFGQLKEQQRNHSTAINGWQSSRRKTGTIAIMQQTRRQQQSNRENQEKKKKTEKNKNHIIICIEKNKNHFIYIKIE